MNAAQSTELQLLHAAESVCKWSLGFLLLLLRLVHIASSSISLRLWNETRKICDSRNQTKTHKSWECRRTSNISRVRWLERSSIKTRQSRYRGDSRLTIVKSLNKHIKWLTEPFLFFALSTLSLSRVCTFIANETTDWNFNGRRIWRSVKKKYKHEPREIVNNKKKRKIYIFLACGLFFDGPKTSLDMPFTASKLEGNMIKIFSSFIFMVYWQLNVIDSPRASWSLPVHPLTVLALSSIIHECIVVYCFVVFCGSIMRPAFEWKHAIFVFFYIHTPSYTISLMGPCLVCRLQSRFITSSTTKQSIHRTASSHPSGKL